MSNVSTTTEAIYQAVLDSLNSSGECGVLPPAPPGKSAYEVAVDNGFVGSENQWLNSLTLEQENEIARLEARIVRGEKFTEDTDYAASRMIGTENGQVPAYWGTTGLSGFGYGGQCPLLANSTNLFSREWVTGYYNGNNLVNAPGSSSGWFYIEAIAGTQLDRVMLRLTQYISGGIYVASGENGVESSWSTWTKVYTEGNTTKEAETGYLVASSPVLKVQHDSFEKVHEAEQLDIDVQHLETGVYEITGAAGLRENDGWNLKPPKDINGNVLCICEATQDGDVITLKTYKKEFDFGTVSIVADYEQPTDIPSGTVVMLRFNDLPQEELGEPEPR